MKPDPTLIGWYYKRGEEHVGPLPVQEVARLLASGQLQPQEMLIGIAEMDGPAGSDVRYSYLDAASVVARENASAGELLRAAPHTGENRTQTATRVF